MAQAGREGVLAVAFDGEGLVDLFRVGGLAGAEVLFLDRTCDFPLKAAPSSMRTREAWMSPRRVPELLITAR